MSRSMFPGATFWIGAVVLTMPVREVSLAEFGRGNIRIGDVVLLGALMLWLASNLFRRRLAFHGNGLDRAVLIFVLLYALSIGWSEQVEWGWIRLLKLVRNGLLYALLASYLRVEFDARYRLVALWLVVTGVLQSLAFVYSIGERGGLDALRIMMEAPSLPSSDPRLEVVKADQGAGLFLRGAASWLPLCMFFGLSLARQVSSRVAAGLIRGSVVLMGALTIVGMTRAAWVSLALAAVVALAADTAWLTVRKVMVVAVCAWVLVAAGWYEVVDDVVRSRLAPEILERDAAVEDRLEFFELAFTRFLDSPVLGTGVSGIDPDEFLVVHNAYLQVLGELGLLGGAIFGLTIWLWVLFLVRVHRRAVGDGDGTGRVVSGAMLSLATFFLTYFLVGHDLGSGEPWIVMAVSSALYSRSGRNLSRARPIEARGAAVPVTS